MTSSVAVITEVRFLPTPVTDEPMMRTVPSSLITQRSCNSTEIGESQEGERWTHKAIEAGNSTAMSNLGARLLDQGDVAQAEHFLRMSVDLDNPAGMYNLGELLRRRGENVEGDVEAEGHS